MAQKYGGLKAVLSIPVIYSLFTLLMGAHRFRQKFVTTSIKPFPGMKILDIGCGPADILAHLPDVAYWGIDVSEEYITNAQKRFNNRGCFQCKEIHHSDLSALPLFDVVLAIGVLHHLEDSVAAEMVELASNALKVGGRLLTIDPCLDPSQSRIARFLIKHDRGEHVRDKSAYRTIVETTFELTKVEVRHKLWIPYTHCFMECTK